MITAVLKMASIFLHVLHHKDFFEWVTSLLAHSVPTKPIFFQRIGDLLEQGLITFCNIVNIALENSTNLWKYDVWYRVW